MRSLANVFQSLKRPWSSHRTISRLNYLIFSRVTSGRIQVTPLVASTTE